MKTIDEYFRDWEATVFGIGYGTGEPHVIPALRRFLKFCPETGNYDYEVLEKSVNPEVAWLLINALVKVDIIEYGISPRFGWLTGYGRALKAYTDSKTSDELVTVVCDHDDDYTVCYPDHCNCESMGLANEKCENPFWKSRRENQT